MSIILSEKTTILFQGDSITDCGRTGSPDPTVSMGGGYPFLLSCILASSYQDYDLTFINRGIGGNRVTDLQGRWQEDCIDLQPDAVSILIGINDTWRRYDNNDHTTTEKYEQVYRDILKQTADTGAQLVILEPFVLHNPEDRATWREDLDPKIGVARKLAREFGATYVPLDGIFAAASTTKPLEFWAGDGVHPTPAGHGLIAQAWLEATGL